MSPGPADLSPLLAAMAKPILKRTWPSGKHDSRCTITAALQLFDTERASESAQLLGLVQGEQNLLRCPIIAVLGELNAGKSSVVSSFLGECGRARLPRGESSRHGTNRFVYWVPQNWESKSTLKSSFFYLLNQVHGQECQDGKAAQHEYLADDPEAAAVQYRNVAAMHIPLIAFDEALNDLNAVFLDCPDVQRANDAAPGAKSRMQFLEEATRLCSAYLLIWEKGKIQHSLFDKMLKSLGKNVYVLINKIRPENGQPTESRNDETLVTMLAQSGDAVRGVYGAFDFEIVAGPHRPGKPSWDALTPPELVQRFTTQNPLPQFFAVATTVDENQPERISSDRFLTHLPAQLDMAELQREKAAYNERKLSEQVQSDLGRIRQWRLEQDKVAHKMFQGLLDFCAARFRNDKGEPLQTPSGNFSQAFQESLWRTAPWYARPGLAVRSVAERAKSIQSKLFGSLKSWLVQRGIKALEEIHSTGVEGARLDDSESFTDEMMKLRWVPEIVQRSDVKRAWEEVIIAFHNFKVEVDEPALDEATKSYWNGLSFWSKLTLILTSIVSALGALTAFAAALLAVVDGGAALFGVLSISAMIPGIPIAQMGIAAAAAGVGAFAGIVAGLVKQNTLPHLAALFQLACDAFGLPQRLPGVVREVKFGRSPQVVRFTLPDVTTTSLDSVCELLQGGLWEETSQFAELERLAYHG